MSDISNSTVKMETIFKHSLPDAMAQLSNRHETLGEVISLHVFFYVFDHSTFNMFYLFLIGCKLFGRCIFQCTSIQR